MLDGSKLNAESFASANPVSIYNQIFTQGEIIDMLCNYSEKNQCSSSPSFNDYVSLDWNLAHHHPGFHTKSGQLTAMHSSVQGCIEEAGGIT